MGKIEGNDNSFPTIKQVNDALDSETTLDITNYVYSIMGLIECSEYQASNDYVMQLCDKIKNGNYTRLKSTSGLIMSVPLTVIATDAGIKLAIFEWLDMSANVYRTSLNLNNYKYKTIKSDLSLY